LDERRVNIVVLQADELRFGLVVDRIDDAQEIVVRPLARQLKGIACFAGATIMGDGRIALILDAFGLAKSLLGDSESDQHKLKEEAKAEKVRGADDGEILLLRDRDEAQFAVPLAEVDRLETFPKAAVEWVAGRPVVQYRGMLLPLLNVSRWLVGSSGRGAADFEIPDPMNVVIHENGANRVGFVFERILDVIDQTFDIRGESGRPGVRFTAVVQERATEVLDLAEIAGAADLGAGKGVGRG